MTHLRSAVWDHFVKLDNAMECQLCPPDKRQPLAGTNAGNAKKHLRHIHPAQFQEVAARDARRAGQAMPTVALSVLAPLEPTGSREPTGHRPSVSSRDGPFPPLPTPRYVSAVWAYFSRLPYDRPTTSVCCLCGQRLLGVLSSNAKKHLRCIHPAEFELVRAKDAENPTILTAEKRKAMEQPQEMEGPVTWSEEQPSSFSFEVPKMEELEQSASWQIGPNEWGQTSSSAFVYEACEAQAAGQLGNTDRDAMSDPSANTNGYSFFNMLPSFFSSSATVSPTPHPRKLKVESPHVKDDGETLTSDYEYRRNKIVSSGETVVVVPERHQYRFQTRLRPQKTGLLLVGLGGNNGTTVVGSTIANREKMTWRTRDGEKKANYFGSITQSTTVHIGWDGAKQVHVPFSALLPTVHPNDLVVDGWDINGANLYEAAQRAKFSRCCELTLIPGVIELAQQHGVFVGGDDFKSGQTKLKSALVEFLVNSGLKPESICSYNHLGNNDGKNLSEARQFRSKEISKSSVVDDMVAANHLLYEDGKSPDHVIVIKYVPHVGDSKRAMDEYVCSIFMGGQQTLVIHNTCEDSLLAAPLILDLAIVTELCTRIQYATKATGGAYESFHSVLSLLALMLKAPVVPQQTPVCNAFMRQFTALTKLLTVCAGVSSDCDLQLEFFTKL
ncbi:Protein INOS-1 [Aphelenchoides avenae]|nr:Protein INOS-1 [Aphelenchus avenae]